MMQRDNMDEQLLYIVAEDGKIAVWHAEARLLKKDRMRVMLYLHPENTPVHPTRRMPLCCLTL